MDSWNEIISRCLRMLNIEEFKGVKLIRFSQSATRAETAAMLMRFLEQLPVPTAGPAFPKARLRLCRASAWRFWCWEGISDAFPTC